MSNAAIYFSLTELLFYQDGIESPSFSTEWCDIACLIRAIGQIVVNIITGPARAQHYNTAGPKVQCSTVQYSTVQCSTVWYRTHGKLQTVVAIENNHQSTPHRTLQVITDYRTDAFLGTLKYNDLLKSVIEYNSVHSC